MLLYHTQAICKDGLTPLILRRARDILLVEVSDEFLKGVSVVGLQIQREPGGRRGMPKVSFPFAA
jgi:hypothetical protein